MAFFGHAVGETTDDVKALIISVAAELAGISVKGPGTIDASTTVSRSWVATPSSRG